MAMGLLQKIINCGPIWKKHIMNSCPSTFHKQTYYDTKISILKTALRRLQPFWFGALNWSSLPQFVRGRNWITTCLKHSFKRYGNKEYLKHWSAQFQIRGNYVTNFFNSIYVRISGLSLTWRMSGFANTVIIWPTTLERGRPVLVLSDQDCGIYISCWPNGKLLLVRFTGRRWVALSRLFGLRAHFSQLRCLCL